jgi:RNA polymerase sigma factor (sigma-70 family)
LTVTDDPPLPEDIRTAILEVVRSRVTIRFALTAEDFTTRVLRSLPSIDMQSMVEYVRTLRLDDLYLATACTLRDEAAWAECGRDHFQFMRDFGRRFLSGSQSADLVDHVIADLWERGKLRAFHGRSTLRTWLGAVVTHAALNEVKGLRKAGERREGGSSAAAAGHGAAHGPENTESERLLTDAAGDAIRSVPADDKLLLLLHYEQGLSLEQISAVVGTSKATLSRRLARIRGAVRERIDETLRTTHGTTGDGVREHVDLGRIELDLAALLRVVGDMKKSGGDTV